MSTINNLKKQIIETSYQAQEGHIPSAFSILDIIWVLYDQILKVDFKNPKDSNRDRFILSKGHGCLGLYAVLAEKGFFPKSVFKTFTKFDSILGAHPDKNKIPGVENSSGSLGHGLPIAVGTALGLKINQSTSKIYCLIGDGEANEGTIWESALLASHHKLSNLCCIVDYNHSTDRALLIGDLVSKFKTFGWKTIEVDGHNQKKIYKALVTHHSSAPLAVIANTIKGNGCKLIENQPAWHHKSPNQEEYLQLIGKL